METVYLQGGRFRRLLRLFAAALRPAHSRTAEAEHLPFAVEETVYLSYWGEMAEITYSGEGKSCSYRVSAGSGDNSGDYNAYPEESRLELGGIPVTAKGDGELYYLILWEKDGYSFSLRFPEGVTGGELEAVFS